MTPPPFELFGRTHLLTLAGMAVIFALFLADVRRVNSAERQALIGRNLSLLLIIQEIASHIEAAQVGKWSYLTHLPLQMCDLSVFFLAYTLWTRRRTLFDICYFWSIGSLHAILTPAPEVPFPHYEYLSNFAGHGMIILAVLYLMQTYRWRPTLRTLHRAVGFTILLLPIIGALNWAIGSNYMYLCEKPPGTTIATFFPDWPWYISILVAVGVFHFYLFYLPFGIADIVRNRRATEKRKSDGI